MAEQTDGRRLVLSRKSPPTLALWLIGWMDGWRSNSHGYQLVNVFHSSSVRNFPITVGTKRK